MYYFSNNDQQFGPFTLDELKGKKITKTTLVWKEGMENWELAENVEELKGIAISVPPPLPNPQNTNAKSNSTIPSFSKMNSDEEPYIPFEEYKEDVALMIGITLIVCGGFIYFINNNSSHNSDLDQLHGFIMVALLLVRIGICYYATQIADRLNRNQTLWGILGFLFPGISMVILGALKRKEKEIVLDHSAPKKIQVEKLIEQAKKYLTEEQYSTAIKFLNKALHIDKDSIPAKFYKAEIYFKKGFHKEAKNIFSLIYNDSSFGTMSNYYIANILIEDKNFEEAKSYLQKALLGKNNDAKLLNDKYYLFQGKYLLNESDTSLKVASYSGYGNSVCKYKSGIAEIDQQNSKVVENNTVYISKYGIVCQFQKLNGENYIAVRYSEIESALHSENEIILNLINGIQLKLYSSDKGNAVNETYKDIVKNYKNFTGKTLN